MMHPAHDEHEERTAARLVARFQGGEREAFAELYCRYFDRVYSYLRVILRKRVDAEDAAQQVFVKVLESLDRYKQRGSFWLWVMVILRNQAIDELRRAGRDEPVDPAELDRRREADHAGLEDEIPLLGWISDDELMLFVERLPLLQRQVLAMRYLLELDNAEIARVLGRTQGDVRVIHHRAIAFLRDRLAAVGQGQEKESKEKPPQVSRRTISAPVLRHRRFALWL
jgi:RNA polymerase sigma-70 factor (ECF subfamily)